MGGVANAPGFSVAALPARSGDQELRFWERASPEARSGHFLADAENRLEQCLATGVDGWLEEDEGPPPLSFTFPVHFIQRETKSVSDAWR